MSVRGDIRMLKTMTLIAAFAGFTIWCPVTIAAGSKHGSWPCVQRKIPEISPGMMWSGPEIKINDHSWKYEQSIADLVHRTTSRRLPIEDAKEEIDKFVKELKSGKNEALTRLFAGQFQTINAERREIMDGIERYAGQQVKLAGNIKELAKKLDALNAKAKLSKDETAQLDQINEKLRWETRIFDEREQSLSYVCETPVLLEQRLFALARHIMQYLEQ